MTTKALYHVVIKYFQKHNPSPATELTYTSPFELLVAVILSAQCTDKRVNLTTPALFRKYPTAEKLALAETEEVFNLIKSISYPNSKAKYLLGMAKMIQNQFSGVIPSDVQDLQKLPGVGRKTANVIASVLFNQPKMAVDTHVFRVSNRIGLTKNAKNPLQTEQQLVKYFPEELIPIAHHWLILHGRYICIARNPKCAICGLKDVCNYYLEKIAKRKK